MLYLRNIFLPKLCLGIFISLNESSEKENDMLFSWWKYFMYKRAGQMEKKMVIVTSVGKKMVELDFCEWKIKNETKQTRKNRLQSDR